MRKALFIIAVIAGTLRMTAQERKIKFACIGDSITYGACLEDRAEDNYPAVLQRMLGDGFEVRNFGVNGATASTKTGRAYSDTDAYRQAQEFAPDIVTIMLGTNDGWPEFWNNKAYANGIRNIVNTMKGASTSPRIIILTPIHATDNEQRDSTIRQPILKVLEWVRDNTGAELLDLYWPLREEAAGHLPDGLHPDPYLDSLIAAHIAHALPLKSTQITQHPYIPAWQQEVRDNIAAWQDYKFGMFIHWGIYSQRGIVESWSMAPDGAEWCYRTRLERGEGFYEYAKNYAALQWSFNPLQFDPSKWAEAARKAGMKYLVFTTKHHDGFCMFDTQQTDYKVTDRSCPFSRDCRSNVAKEIFDAFRAEGLATGAYFSIPDWHNEDYWYPMFPPRNSMMNYDIERFPEKWERYNNYVNAQLNELTTGYGPLNLIWFDVATLPVTTYAPMEWEMFERTVRGNQPGIMMVARTQRSIYENYRTPEQQIPDKVLDYPWESCMTMSTSWSWRPDAKYKSPDEVLAMLVKIVSRGGNLLLNVGPRPDGTLDDEAYELMESIGAWMDVNSEGIYATKPFELGGEGIYGTTKDGKVYAFHIPPGDEASEELLITGVKPESVALLGYGKKIKWTRTEEGFRVRIPEDKAKDIICLKISPAL